MSDIVVAALYKFASVADLTGKQARILAHCQAHGIYGTLLLAAEGINGTIAGTRAGIDATLAYLRSYPEFSSLEHKESYTADCPFLRMKVRLKREIVTMGHPMIDPTNNVGTYVDPEAWNALLADPEVLVVDTRNDYEVKLGSFAGAVDPDIKTFREFPDWAADHLNPTTHKKIAMFCTGGIRCEKSTSLLVEQGFEQVFHLRGGILKYLEEVPKQDSQWQGDCFVFDQRVAVDHDLQESGHSLCFGCQHPLNPSEMTGTEFEQGVQCRYCVGRADEATLASRRERQLQVSLAQERGEAHLGEVNPRNTKQLR